MRGPKKYLEATGQEESKPRGAIQYVKARGPLPAVT